MMSLVGFALGIAGAMAGASCSEAPSPPPVARSLAALVNGEYKIETNDASAAYLAACRNTYNIPVPDRVIDLTSGWSESMHRVAHPFIRADLAAEVWSYETSAGVCIAMPRLDGSGRAESLNMICMANTGETCFFAHKDTVDPEDEEDKGFLIPPELVDAQNVPLKGLPIEDFLGGTDLEGKPAGACSDCHIGENPFIIHPNDPAFHNPLLSQLSIFPSKWPTPIVPASFPGNPPPIEVLAPLSPAGSSNCNPCHGVGSGSASAGRFAQVNSDHPGFCDLVLHPALSDVTEGPTFTPPTMPPGSTTTTHTSQTKWLFDACQSPLGAGQVVRFEPPPAIEVFPPVVVAPYACTRFVTVTEAIPGAQLELFDDSGLIATEMATNSVAHIFEVKTPWVMGQDMHVIQTFDGSSATSLSVSVRDHKEDHEGGLLPPIIGPAPIYECASKIAVHNVPGATIKVTKVEASKKSGGSPATKKVWSRTRTSGTDHSWMNLDNQGPFDIGDRFVATQKICNDESEASPVQIASNAPSDIGLIQIDPPIVGQTVLQMKGIVQGASVKLDELPSLNIIDVDSWPFRHLRLDVSNTLGPIEASHQLIARQRLCGVSFGKSQLIPIVPCNNNTLESFAPEVAAPHGGNEHVVVLDAVPGALVRVFATDANLDQTVELGNGTGSVIHLSRKLVQGETIAVAQQLLAVGNGNGCFPTHAYVIVVN